MLSIIDRTFSEVEVETIMEMVLQDLSLIHSKNLIHRDIKGANILLSEDGDAKLGDFGVGAYLSNQKYRKSKKGSPFWMSRPLNYYCFFLKLFDILLQLQIYIFQYLPYVI